MNAFQAAQPELEGQMSLFTLDDADQWIQDQYADEVCRHCGGHCTSSKECVDLAGEHEDADSS